MALHSLTDEYPDSQKQTGCMTGILQFFDRYQMGVSVKRISDRSHKSTIQCHSQSADGRVEEEFIEAHQGQPAEMNAYRNASDRQRFSTESSRASVSSSRSSSFSSVDYYRGTHPDSAHNDRITFSEAAFENSYRTVSPRIARQSADIRDVVKDSMLRKARGVSLKTTSREESMNCGLKRRDSLKDLKLFKTVDGAWTKGSQHVCDNLKESIDVLSKIQGAEWKYNERKEQRRMPDYGYRLKDRSHPSYDGMETSRLSFDSREAISASKLRDLPRLSLDGREFLTRQVDCDLSLNFQSATSLRKSYSTKEKGLHLMEESATQKQRSPSVIAKLMGITALPDSSTSATQSDGSFIRTRNAQVGLNVVECEKPVVDSKAPSSKKDPAASTRCIISDTKPISSSRIPVEQAPWKNQEKGATLFKHSSRKIRSPTKQSNPMPSVYSEIEKRLTDIEFNQSGKDLRALKQILDSIHAKGLLEDEKQNQASKVATAGKQESTLIKEKPKTASTNQQNAEGIAKHDSSFRSSDMRSQIVIKKTVSRSPRSLTSTNMHSDHVISFNEKCKSTQQSSRPQQQLKNNSASSLGKLGSTSPRIRLRKLESEKQNQFPIHSSDPSKHRVQVSNLQTESSSPGRKVLPRITNKQQNGNQVSEILLEIKKMRSQRNEAPLPAQRNVRLDCKRDKEVTRTMRSIKVNGSHSPSRKASTEVGLACDKSPCSNHLSLPVKHEEMTAPEHPSPVSVLNMSPPYMDDSSTEEKQIATPPAELAEGYGTFKSNLTGELVVASEISRKKLLSIDSLVQKLKRLNSTHDESRTDYIALLCDNTNPDHRYISEILLASGLLLREFGSDAIPFQLHPSGFLINPELFNVLEQTKFSANTSINANADESKSHRKLIFNMVNEMLTRKLASNGNLDYSVKRRAKKAINTQNLIKELCAEMEQLQPKKKKNRENNIESEDERDAVKDLLWKDVMCSGALDKWNVYDRGMSEVVLDIERSLFKKLVNEIVISDYRVGRPKSGNGHNRFMK